MLSRDNQTAKKKSTIQACVLIGLTSTQAPELGVTVKTQLDVEDTDYDDNASFDSQTTPSTAQASTTNQDLVTPKDTTIFDGDLAKEKTRYAQTF